MCASPVIAIGTTHTSHHIHHVHVHCSCTLLESKGSSRVFLSGSKELEHTAQLKHKGIIFLNVKIVLQRKNPAEHYNEFKYWRKFLKFYNVVKNIGDYRTDSFLRLHRAIIYNKKNTSIVIVIGNYFFAILTNLVTCHVLVCDFWSTSFYSAYCGSIQTLVPFQSLTST